MHVSDVLAALVASEEGGRAMIAARLGASESSLARWLAGRTRPQPDVERQIRSLAAKRGLVPDEAQPTLFQPAAGAESTVRMALSATLRQVREVLHSTGRLSSRHEALDEVAKLLFAHVISIDTGGPGIDRDLLGGPSAAPSLRAFVEGVFRLHLPVSLAHEVTPADFHLRLKDSEHALANSLIDCFGRLASPEIMRQMRDVGSADLVNDTFGQFLVDSFSDEKELGQYLTPPEVVRFMVRLGLHSMLPEHRRQICEPETSEATPIILDPSCGVGSFLAETMRVLYADVREQHGPQVLPKWIARTMTKALVGVDKSERMIRLALTNLAMFGAPTVNLHLANALARHGNEGKTMDGLQGRAALILTNPPFGAEFDRSDVSAFRISRLWANGSASTMDSEVLFMERYLDWLAPGGVLVGVVPDSILTNQGVFASLRRGVAASVDILSIISLPPVTFAAAGTNTKTSIVHLRKKVTGIAAPKVYFAICQDIGFDVSKRGSQRVRVKTDRNDLEPVLAEVTGQTSLVVGRCTSFDPEEPRWDATFHAGLADSVMQKLEARDGLPTILADVADLVNERTNPSRFGDGEFEYIEISDIDGASVSVRSSRVACKSAPSRARKLVAAGDVLISTVRPERKAIGIVPPWLDGAVCSTGIAVLRPKKVHSLVLARVLQTDLVNLQLLRNNIGIAYPAFDETCLPKVILPLKRAAMEKLTTMADRVATARNQVAGLERDFDAAVIAEISG